MKEFGEDEKSGERLDERRLRRYLDEKEEEEEEEKKDSEKELEGGALNLGSNRKDREFIFKNKIK